MGDRKRTRRVCLTWRSSGIEGQEKAFGAMTDTVKFAGSPWGPRLPVAPPHGPALSGMLAA